MGTWPGRMKSILRAECRLGLHRNCKVSAKTCRPALNSEYGNNLMANAGGNTLATRGFKPRPAGREVSREFSSNFVAILFRCCDECRWNYILKEDEVPGSNPGGSSKRGHSSKVERVNTFHQFCRHSYFATNAGETTCNPTVAGSSPASGPKVGRSSSVGRAAEMFRQILSSRLFGWPVAAE